MPAIAERMMKVVIIEDEVAAASRLYKLVKKAEPEAQCVFQADSIESAAEWFSENSDYDLVFMDIQLADGLSFDIFERARVGAPVIFTTAFDEYALKAFKVNSLDYLLKPIDEKELQAALNKFRNHYPLNRIRDYSGLTESYRRENKFSRERFLVSKGHKFLSISVSEIACFYSEDKASFIYTFDRQRYIWNQSLDEIEQALPADRFFRASRSLLVCAAAIGSIEQGFNGKLILHLNPQPDGEYGVSREKAQAFKHWLGS
jgi:DNA-binding LytR/AlgR family response regulator